MRGLRTQENEKFNRFWEIIQSKAASEGMMFFADCGEGREFFLENMEGEDMRGWLIPANQIEEFKPEWEKYDVSDKWIDNIFWAEWSIQNGIVSVEFNTY